MNRFFLFLSTIFLSCFIHAQQDTASSLHLSFINEDLLLQTNPAKAKGTIFKRLLDALKFKKNARAKEKERILSIIEKTNLTRALQLIDSSLRNINTHLDSFNDSLDYIKQFALRDTLAIAAIFKKIDSLKQEVAAIGKKAPAKNMEGGITPLDEVDVPPGEEGAGDIEKVINELLASVSQTDTEKVARIRQLQYHPSPNVQLIKKAEVLGYYPWQDNRELNERQLAMISTVSFYAIRFNATTGELDKRWSSSSLLAASKNAGCRIELTVLSDAPAEQAAFLKNDKAQKSLVREIISQLKTKNDAAANAKKADGVNIVFKKLDKQLKNDFTAFISELAKTFWSVDNTYRLCITVPAFDNDSAYNLAALNGFADRFVIDFTDITDAASGGPLAPMTGAYANNIKTCINRYLNPGTGIDPSKLIVSLPYYGVMWETPAEDMDAAPQFLRFVTYSDIQRYLSFFSATPSYDPVALSAYFRYVNNGKDTLIWFDDDKTLAPKYDFILNNGLGGVAIKSLGYDGEYGELWNLLAAKFFTIDTLAATEATVPDSSGHWQWNWSYIKAKYEQYYFLFAYPCEVNYPKVLVNKWRKAGIYNNDRTAIKKEAIRFLGIFCIIQLIFFAAVLYLFIYRLRNTGDSWKRKKLTGAILLLQFVLLSISFSMYLFLGAKVLGFGASDSQQDCFDFPYGTLFLFLGTGLLAGGIVTRYLIFPLLKKNEVP